jgi:hypothetical protein
MNATADLERQTQRTLVAEGLVTAMTNRSRSGNTGQDAKACKPRSTCSDRTWGH